jgi:organic radical activating enzyme
MSIRCVHIESGLRVTNYGTTQPCCYFDPNIDYKDEEGKKVNVNSTTLPDVFKNKTLSDLRKQFNKGERPVECTRCWKEEDAGIESKRIRDTRNFGEKKLINTVRFLELNLGNTCNFACRMCGIEASIKWYKEDRKLRFDDKTDKEYNSYVKKMYKSYEDDSLFWKSVYEVAPTLETIDMYGGEPFLVKKQWEFLKELIRMGYSKNIRLHFNTNGSIFNEEYVKILDEFKHTTISFSIDGIEDKFNYIRYHGDWVDVLKNMNKWNDATKDKLNYRLDICVTVSVLNILDLGEMSDFFTLTFPNMPLFFNQVSWPLYYSVKCIPNNFKGKITEKLISYAESIDLQEVKDQVYTTIEFMNKNSAPIESFNKFFKVNDFLDVNRKEEFQKTFPELSNIFKPYINKNVI